MLINSAHSSDENRVVVTGMGIVSCLGRKPADIIQHLKNGISGIRFDPNMQEMGLRSQISGHIALDLKNMIDRKILRFMGSGAAFAYLSLLDAIEDAQLDTSMVSHPLTGLIAGSGGISTENTRKAYDLATQSSIKKMGPYRVTQTMASAISACLSVAANIQGISYSLCSACASSTHSVGHAARLIRNGTQNLMFAGGGEEHDWLLAGMFDAMGALSKGFNDRPAEASRPFDLNRDGFVISSGGGILVLESLKHALDRGAKIYAEITGYGATSDGADMVSPSGEGAVRCMKHALNDHHTLSQKASSITYINAHATSTAIGDQKELNAIQSVFKEQLPHIGSTKSLAGHSLGATGIHEIIYSLLMMKAGFLAPSINIDQPDQDMETLPFIKETIENINVDSFLTNSFGFGGTNASLIFEKWDK